MSAAEKACVFTVSTDNSFDFLSDEYTSLFQRSCATAFQHPIWLDSLYRRLVPALGVQPLIITVRTDGVLVLVLPLIRRRFGLMSLVEFADLRVSDYVAPVCDSETFHRVLADTATCQAIQQALKPYDLLRIQKVPQGALPLERLLGVSGRSAMAMSAHSTPLRAPYTDWRKATLESSYQKELDKKRRKLGRKGQVILQRLQDPQAMRTAFERMRGYRDLRFGAEDLLQTPLYFEFYLDVTVRGTPTGLARLYALTLDDEPIAVVWGLAQRQNFLVLLTGFDLAGYKTVSLGSIVFEDVAQDCIEKGDVVLDFTIGDESYKRLFGAQPSSMWMISSAGSPFGTLANFVVDHVPWASKVAKRLVQGSAGATAPAKRSQLQEHD